MQLKDIKDIVIKYAKAISDILNVNVTVIDKDLVRIANTYPYLHEPTTVRHDSIVGTVISTGKSMAVDNISNYAPCKRCPDFKECSIDGVIGVPIICNGEILGAFCLMVPRSRSNLFLTLNTTMDFLESMVDLLAEKIISTIRYQELQEVRCNQDTIMNAVEYSIAFTSLNGVINYCNGNFRTHFGIHKDPVGQKISNIITHPLIANLLQDPFCENRHLIYYENAAQNCHFSGLVSCYPQNVNNVQQGILFVFKSLDIITTEVNEVSFNRSHMFFNHIWVQGKEMQSILDRAKLLAPLDETVLIQGEGGIGKEAIAKAIHNFSDRSNQCFVTVDCATTALEALNRELFGYDDKTGQAIEIGKLRLAHKGTLLFKDIDEMPLCFQKQIAEFFKLQKRSTGWNDYNNLDVRMIFTCSGDIHELVKKGYFCEDLYYRIIKNVLSIPAFSNRKSADIVTAIESAIKWFKKQHHKPNLQFEQEAMEVLSQYSWPRNMREMEIIIDRLVYTCDSVVAAEDVYRAGVKRSAPPIKPIEDIEKEQIQRMMAQGCRKDVIARTLGFSRATLYRKLKKHGIAE